jgi:Flp pilus assembly protein TadG
VSAKAPRRGWRSDERGATALEFALVIPVAIVFLIGVFQIAWAMHVAATVRWALERDSRVLMMTPTTTADQLKTAMVTDMHGVANPQSLTVALATDSSNPASKIINATSTFSYPLWIPFVPTRTLNFTATTAVPTL